MGKGAGSFSSETPGSSPHPGSPAPSRRGGKGGHKPGSGRTQEVVGGRSRCRAAADDPVRWAAYLKAIDAQLAEGVTSGFEALFRNGYGSPPQALDVRTPGVLDFRVSFDDGTPVFAETEAVPEEAHQ